MNSPILLAALPAVPALGALLLSLFGRRLPYNAVGGIATLAAGVSFAIALSLLPLGLLGTGGALTLDLGSWIATSDFHASFKFTLDSVSQTMVLLVTFFGFVITGYSVGYMRHDRQQGRFFASLNLFVASMLVLVLADNLALIFLGWEGVGVCSYLLIGHYWDEKGVPLAAFRAFFVNRIGDLLFLLGVFTAFAAFGTLSLSDLSTMANSAHGASALFAGREHLAALVALLLLGGAFAKSAQAPLHVWLADAMAGPTPVSALIHAATMVTAGVYLIARLDWLYAVVPQARFLIGVASLVTLVVGAFMALTQHDIKKILAYSTLSNLALMFLALAAGSSRAAMLHLFGHAFFKALLFLSAGSVIFSAHHEQDARRLGGSLRTLPVTRLAFWVGCIGGAGLIPFFSAGFFTKESVLESIHQASFEGFGLHVPGHVLYWIVLAVESLSALYLFRLLGYLEGSPGAVDAHDAHGSHDHGHHEAPREPRHPRRAGPSGRGRARVRRVQRRPGAHRLGHRRRGRVRACRVGARGALPRPQHRPGRRHLRDLRFGFAPRPRAVGPVRAELEGPRPARPQVLVRRPVRRHRRVAAQGDRLVAAPRRRKRVRRPAPPLRRDRARRLARAAPPANRLRAPLRGADPVLRGAGRLVPPQG
jgi:NADH-quinone oxidoreductase subunit L